MRKSIRKRNYKKSYRKNKSLRKRKLNKRNKSLKKRRSKMRGGAREFGGYVWGQACKLGEACQSLLPYHQQKVEPINFTEQEEEEEENVRTLTTPVKSSMVLELETECKIVIPSTNNDTKFPSFDGRCGIKTGNFFTRSGLYSLKPRYITSVAYRIMILLKVGFAIEHNTTENGLFIDNSSNPLTLRAYGKASYKIKKFPGDIKNLHMRAFKTLEDYVESSQTLIFDPIRFIDIEEKELLKQINILNDLIHLYNGHSIISYEKEPYRAEWPTYPTGIPMINGFTISHYNQLPKIDYTKL
tara:strand:- start:2462 stop:3358 length:897 start_codon:yes stop_codon:yes gene_type:complete